MEEITWNIFIAEYGPSMYETYKSVGSNSSAPLTLREKFFLCKLSICSTLDASKRNIESDETWNFSQLFFRGKKYIVLVDLMSSFSSFSLSLLQTSRRSLKSCSVFLIRFFLFHSPFLQSRLQSYFSLHSAISLQRTWTDSFRGDDRERGDLLESFMRRLRHELQLWYVQHWFSFLTAFYHFCFALQFGVIWQEELSLQQAIKWVQRRVPFHFEVYHSSSSFPPPKLPWLTLCYPASPSTTIKSFL